MSQMLNVLGKMSSDEVKKHLLKFNPSKFKNAFYVQILQF